MEKIMIQPDICDGCGDCEEACARLHGTSRITVREIDDSHYPIVCQQCEDAPCVMICPTEAMTNEVSPEKCIGCGLCMMVCPFGAISMHDRKAHKCNQCPDKDTPACVAACSKRAIAKIDTERMKLKKQNEHIAKLSGLGKKKRKSTDFISVLTANARTNKVLHKEVES